VVVRNGQPAAGHTHVVDVSLRRVAVTWYVAWLVAVVLVMAGRYTSFPLLPGAEAGVVVGTAVFAVVGAAQLSRAGLRRLRET
jgi:hypothetical protein